MKQGLRPSSIFRYCLCLLCVVALLGCQASKPGKAGVNSILNKSSTVLGLRGSYESIKRDFENGRIMQARERTLAMDKTDRDYAKAQRLLQKKIEPARQRLYSHFLGAARKAEKSKQWHKASQAYEQAKDVSLQPAEMEQKRLQMELNLRQLRLETLLKQRRAEDEFLLRQMRAFEPPVGINPTDEVFLRKREEFEDELDHRASLSYREALRFLRKGMPEVAYVDIESYLRLQPDSDRGKRLMEEVKRALPKQLSIPGLDRKATAVKARTAAKHRSAKRAPVSTSKRQVAKVTADQIRVTMKRGEWLRAKQYALAYRREGGAGADALLERIQAAIEKEAAVEFARGGEFFRLERLDRAIIHWQKAVTLMPDEAEYVEALRRARQLKERLNLLRQGSSPSAAEQ